MSKSILIAASPFVLRDGRVGSVLAHVAHMVRHGGVFWVLIQPGEWWSEEFMHPDLKSAYFYDVPTKSVLYRAKVEFAGTREEFPDKKRYNQYFPDFRAREELKNALDASEEAIAILQECDAQSSVVRLTLARSLVVKADVLSREMSDDVAVKDLLQHAKELIYSLKVDSSTKSVSEWIDRLIQEVDNM